MRRFTCQYEELDEKTRDYLRTVRNAGGARMPGVFFGRSNSRPILALIFGPIIGLVFIGMGAASLKDAWAAAMLQTAGVLLGGWMVLYAFRRFFAKGSPKFAGFYHYFDPHAAYVAQGEQVTVTDVTNVTGVSAVGGQGNAAVRFEGGGETAVVPGLKPPQAVLVEDYYAAMEWITNRDEGGKNLSTAVLGGAAKEYALTEQLPRDYAELNLEVEDLPASPEKVRTAGPRILWYGLLLGGTAATFALFASVNKPLRDESAFQSAGNSPTGLRAYLLDVRNTAHRAEAEKKLSDLYQTKADAARIHAGADPVLREGTAKLLESLKGAEPPVVSIRVTNDAKNQSPLAEFELKNLQELIGDGIAQAVGPEYIRFLVPEPGENPHVEVVVSSSPGRAPTCDVAIRLKPDGEPVVRKSITVAVAPAIPPPPGAPPAPPDVTSAVKNSVLTALVGSIFAAPVPVPDDDGE